jgi:hypothetical protein
MRKWALFLAGALLAGTLGTSALDIYHRCGYNDRKFL